jgi:hypothetical protein
MSSAPSARRRTRCSDIDWGYTEADEVRTRWLVSCATRATERARPIAEALGVRLLGVHRFGEPEVQPQVAYDVPRGVMAGAPRGRMTSEDFGLSVAHSQKVVVRVVAEFRISGYV